MEIVAGGEVDQEEEKQKKKKDQKRGKIIYRRPRRRSALLPRLGTVCCGGAQQPQKRARFPPKFLWPTRVIFCRDLAPSTPRTTLHKPPKPTI